MDNIVFSKLAYEDLQKIKYLKMEESVIDGVIAINNIIDEIHLLPEKELHEKYEEEFYFLKIGEYYAFYKIDENEDEIEIVRILNEDLDYIKEIFN